MPKWDLRKMVLTRSLRIDAIARAVSVFAEIARAATERDATFFNINNI